MAMFMNSIRTPIVHSGLLRRALAAFASTVAQPCIANELAAKEALASTALTALLPAPLPSLTSAFAARRAIFGDHNG